MLTKHFLIRGEGHSSKWNFSIPGVFPPNKSYFFFKKLFVDDSTKKVPTSP